MRGWPFDRVVHVGVALEVEVVQQRGDAPQRLVAAEAPRVGAHAGLHGQDVLAQAVAGDPFADQLPGFVTGW